MKIKVVMTFEDREMPPWIGKSTVEEFHGKTALNMALATVKNRIQSWVDRDGMKFDQLTITALD